MRLAPFQKVWLDEVLADGVSAAAMRIPRGNGKSTLLAAVALWGLFDDDEHGAPQIPIVASTLQQAKRSVYSPATSMVSHCEFMADRAAVFSGVGTERITVPSTGGELFPIASDSSGLQGLDPSLAVCDELGFIAVESWDSLLLAAGKRPRSLTIGIGTPGFDRDNALWLLEQRVLEGHAMPGFHFTGFAADPGCRIDDELQWAKANPALEHGFMNIAALRTAVSMSAEANFRIFRLGQWIEGTQGWLGENGREMWDKLRDPYPLAPKAATWLGVDIGLKRDSSAVVACQLRPDGRRHVTARIWTPTPDGRLDVSDVMAHLRWLAAGFDIQSVSYDPRFFDLAAQALLDEGLPMVEVPQSLERMTPIVGAAFDAIKQNALSHDGDALFAAHVLDARARTNERGFTLSKGKSRDHIDAAIAMCLAIHAAQVTPAAAKAAPRAWAAWV